MNKWRKYLWVEKHGDEYAAWIKVEHQTFKVGPCWETEEEAAWYLDMLEKALCKADEGTP